MWFALTGVVTVRVPQDPHFFNLHALSECYHIYNYEEIERIPYMAPGLVDPEKAERGKTLTDTWWHTIVPTNGKEKTGYPTQKLLGILKWIVQVSSPPKGIVLDFFAGSGTTGAACLELGRRFILVDNNLKALEVMAQRFGDKSEIKWINFDPKPYQKVPISEQKTGVQGTLFDIENT